MDFAKSGFLNRNHPIAASSYSSPALWTISPGASNDPEEKIDDRRIALNKITLNNDIMIDQLEKIQKYEMGANRISASRLFRISRVLGVDVNYFFQGAGTDGRETFCSTLGKQEKDVMQMLEAFSRIEDREMRKSLLRLCRNYIPKKS